MVFSKDAVNGCWKWGEYSLPIVSSYSFLGIYFSRNGGTFRGEKSDTFTIERGVAQGCSLSPILFSVFINDLLKEIEQTGLGIQLSSGKTVGGMLFADDFVGISDSKESLQKLLDVVYSYCNKWRL